MNSKHRLAVASAIGILSITGTAWSYSGGRTGSATVGCGTAASCHGTVDSTTMVRIMGPTTARPNEAVMLTFVMSSPTRMNGGLDIAAVMGAITTAAANVGITSGELTHRMPLAAGAGTNEIRVPFTWTAPRTAGSVTIHAAGNAVNLNSARTGDGWNTATHTITVSNSATPDAGTPDAATPADAATSPDAAMTPDAAPGQDAATSPDAAPSEDASTPAQDATMQPMVDAMVPRTDSGTSPDGGMSMTTPGCACTTAATSRSTPGSLGGLASIALALTLASRRRR
ncbi:MAG: choice-of-anchor V domain-containing protein [Deltaproteobacteria bacterium]|nr:choice-of-anchor V domain-containing protein [Deltaproteobacteria bacterium]